MEKTDKERIEALEAQVERLTADVAELRGRTGMHAWPPLAEGAPAIEFTPIPPGTYS